MNQMKSICVFCGSRTGNNPAYAEAAKALGRGLAERKLGMVFGGGHVGLMGVVADAVLDAGGTVIGVIPDFLVARELAHPRLSELIVVTSMHERKAIMAERSDGFIAMPGGFGTFEEFCEILTWGQLRLHQKPMGLLNVAGYYDPLLQLFDQALSQDFLSAKSRALLLEAAQPEHLLELMLRQAQAESPAPDLLEKS